MVSAEGLDRDFPTYVLNMLITIRVRRSKKDTRVDTDTYTAGRKAHQMRTRKSYESTSIPATDQPMSGHHAIQAPKVYSFSLVLPSSRRRTQLTFIGVQKVTELKVDFSKIPTHQLKTYHKQPGNVPYNWCNPHIRITYSFASIQYHMWYRDMCYGNVETGFES